MAMNNLAFFPQEIYENQISNPDIVRTIPSGEDTPRTGVEKRRSRSDDDLETLRTMVGEI